MQICWLVGIIIIHYLNVSVIQWKRVVEGIAIFGSD